jgi:hypothetical protein
MVVALDGARAESPLEEMADAVVPLVEALRVAEVEEVHPVCQAFERAEDDEMKVVRHQAEREQLPVVLAACCMHEGHEALAVDVVGGDRLPGDTAGGDVVHAGWRQ